MPSLSPLYLIADCATCAPRALEDVLREALNAGLRFIQVREKKLETDALRRLTESLLHLAEPFEATLLLNTRADLAVELGAQGVHLPASGVSPTEIRQTFGTRLLIGCSVHNHTELDRVKDADFATFSPIYTPS
ncbi:MAG: thiamine phosphate synthase, partial [bacterium]|nr:thiamine phosphate synthase [bacterium]